MEFAFTVKKVHHRNNGKRNFYDISETDEEYSGSSALWFYSEEKANKLLEKVGRTISNLEGYTFKSKCFSDAWNRHVFTDISSDEIEDSIIVPTLSMICSPDTNSYTYDSIDKYFDKVVFDDKELVCITPDRKYNKYYDCTKWLNRLQAKVPNVQLEAILDEDAYDVKPRGSSFWYIRATKDGNTRAAIMGFSQNFIMWLD